MLQDFERWQRGQASAELLAILPAAVYTVDAEGRITYFNAKAVELWGRAPRMNDDDERFCGSFRLYLPDGSHLPHDQTPMAAALRGAGSVRDMEVILARPDGTRIPVRANIDPLLDESGRINGAINVFLDATARDERDRALQRSEQRYRSLVAATAAVVWITDAHGSFVTPQASWESYTGQPWEAHRGFGWKDAIHPDDRERIREAWLQCLRQKRGYEGSGRLWHAPTSQYRHFEMRAVPVIELDGSIHEWIGTGTDVHERRQAEMALLAAREAAEAASRAKDEFLAMLGHELRNPLSPIATALALMRGQPGAAFERERAVIERQVGHMTRLVDDLLDTSRILNGKLELKRSPLELADVIAKAVEMASPLLEQRGSKLRTSVPSGLQVHADAHRLAQVFSNLLTNAAKYSEPGGSIQVRAEQPSGRVRVSVTDDGMGIDPELLPRVFELFIQGHRSIARSQGGLGLGLPIVKSLTEMHGGSVSAHSAGPGKGSRFVVELPLLRDHDADESSAGAPPPSRSAARARCQRVLVVDDNRDAAELLAEALAAHGYETRVAFDGPSALAIVSAGFDLDCAMLDIGLPVMDGYELAVRLREARPERPPRLVAITGYGMAVDRERTRAAGFDEHVVKPAELGVLLRLLQTLPPPPDLHERAPGTDTAG